MNRFKIGETEIFLENYQDGQGKIIISNLYIGSFSYYWGAMGKSIEDFLCSTNADYFASKLCNVQRVFSGINTAKAIRKFIKNEMKYELPWYKYMEGQKEMREEIRRIEKSDNQYEALSIIESIKDSVFCLNMDRNEEDEFRSILESTFNNEPWLFLEDEYSREYKWLRELHKKIKKHLSK